MNELALFAGAGGSILAGELLGWRTVAAVECDAYCVATLLHRQQEGTLAPFPIWDDIRTFDGTPFRGVVDIITAGFPCQPFSTASRGRITTRDLWSETLRVICEVQPCFVLLENVQRAPVIHAGAELVGVGYRAAAARVSAACMGAAHRRPRWWLVAHIDGHGEHRMPVNAQAPGISQTCGLDCWETFRPELLGVDDGLAFGMERLRALGNGWVPSVAALAWRTLTSRLPSPQ